MENLEDGFLLIEEEHHLDEAGYLFSVLRLYRINTGTLQKVEKFNPTISDGDKMGICGKELTPEQINYLRSLEGIITYERPGDYYYYIPFLKNDETDAIGLSEYTLDILRQQGIRITQLPYEFNTFDQLQLPNLELFLELGDNELL